MESVYASFQKMFFPGSLYIYDWISSQGQLYESLLSILLHLTPLHSNSLRDTFWDCFSFYKSKKFLSFAITNIFTVKELAFAKEVMFSWAFGRWKRKMHGMGCCASLHLYLCGPYRKINWRAFEGIEKDPVYLRNNLLSPISFWCTHEIPISIED